MNARQPPSAVIPYAGLLLAIAGIIYQSGQLTGDVRRNAERITSLEAKDAVRSGSDINQAARLARIEAKLDLLIPAGKKDAP